MRIDSRQTLSTDAKTPVTLLVLFPQEVTLLRKYNDKPIMTRPQHKFFTGANYLEVGD